MILFILEFIRESIDNLWSCTIISKHLKVRCGRHIAYNHALFIVIEDVYGIKIR